MIGKGAAVASASGRVVEVAAIDMVVDEAVDVGGAGEVGDPLVGVQPATNSATTIGLRARDTKQI
ncbi:MAG: hypothetical protein LC739_02920 [Actinobacteria bacterium]|nr:hypothetical protein [Acidimicrobiia bacterium]MCA1735085.1 hypothetical protein [Actinomycetota bacterium]MDQ3501588.1 hypothetical protein [Actinomycetota bacterium]